MQFHVLQHHLRPLICLRQAAAIYVAKTEGIRYKEPVSTSTF
jgi:hypothetical protein